MYNLQNYNSELGEILGFIDNEGNKWLSAKQIGKWLELSNIRKILPNIDEDNKKFVKTSDCLTVTNGYTLSKFGMTFVNYEGFLEICFISRTEKAKQVKKFVAKIFKEVVETGSCGNVPNEQLSEAIKLLEETKECLNSIKEKDKGWYLENIVEKALKKINRFGDKLRANCEWTKVYDLEKRVKQLEEKLPKINQLTDMDEAVHRVDTLEREMMSYDYDRDKIKKKYKWIDNLAKAIINGDVCSRFNNDEVKEALEALKQMYELKSKEYEAIDKRLKYLAKGFGNTFHRLWGEGYRTDFNNFIESFKENSKIKKLDLKIFKFEK